MCVCGQLYGGYDEDAVTTIVGGWVRRLIFGDFDTVARRYGFNLPLRFDNGDHTLTHGEAWAELTTAWKSEVYARRRAEAA